jgi:starch phosphorylase
MNKTRNIHTQHDPSLQDTNELDSLGKLALDMRWAWDHGADEIWQKLDPDLWELTHNPWVVLQTVSRDQLHNLKDDPVFFQKVQDLLRSWKQRANAPAWFQGNHPHAPLTHVAYFSMEFMLSEALPIYSGGLGNVAGDHLKTSSDLGVPVAGVGLLYQQGYFRQLIDKDGWQQALFPYNDPSQLPISPLREENGEWLRLDVPMPGGPVWLRVWLVHVGRTRLFLLDSNDAANFPAHRGITSELYGSGLELRLKQEMVLGIGGWRLIETLGIKPEVCHLNEGHAAFAVLERARHFMDKTGQTFETALAVTRAGNLFTTHTAVNAAFDRFPPELIEKYLGDYARNKLKIPLHALLSLGRQNPEDDHEDFAMPYLAIRGSGAVNGVSRLHGKVSRHIFQPLFYRWPEEEVPVGYVTNGVHMSSWDSAEADDLWTEACGKDRWMGKAERLEQEIRGISDERLWQLRTDASRAFIDYVRLRLYRQLAASGSKAEEIEEAKRVFDPGILIVGFARRFATYKRPNLLLLDPERLLRLLTDPQHPVQLVIAGKAHPADRAGQELIREWIRFAQRPEARRHVVFLSDYDMLLTEHLVQGVDVWINTPKRPWEACGTSGMKVLVNGGLNLSELDGWWAEAYAPEVGWALGDGHEHGDDPAWDAAEAQALYDLLENEVIPDFYTRDSRGIPMAWVHRMRESMARLTPQYSANRSVCEYAERYYLPAAAAFLKRSKDKGGFMKRLVAWRDELARWWPHVRFGEIKAESDNGTLAFDVQVYLCSIGPEKVSVELYAEGINGKGPVKEAMVHIRALKGAGGGHLYRARISTERPASDYTPRILPHFEGLAVPLEAAYIRWPR